MIFNSIQFERADTSDIAQAGVKNHYRLRMIGTDDTYLHMSGVGTTQGTTYAWCSTRERGDRLITRNGLDGFRFVHKHSCGKRPAPINDLNDI